MSRFVVLVALAGTYFLAGKLGLSLAQIHPSASAVWPPTGIAIAACLLWGYRVWPAVFLGAFLVNLTTVGTVWTSLGIATGNALEAVVGAYLVNRWAGGTSAFRRPAGLFAFAALAGGLATATGATVGVTTLCLGGYSEWAAFAPVWLTWWLGDMAGALVVTPPLVLWLTPEDPPQARRPAFEFFVLAGVLVLVAQAVFGTWMPFGLDTRSLEFLPLPVLVWAGFRLGPRLTATAVLALEGIALLWTLQGSGPLTPADPNQRLLVVQAYMATASLMSLGLAAAVRERREAQAEATAGRERLDLVTARLQLSQEQTARAEAEAARRRLTLEYAVTRVLAESDTISDAATGAPQAVCESLGWEAGGLWMADSEAAGVLRCIGFWHMASLDAQEFGAISREMTFSPGIGLPGRVGASGEPAWIRDVVEDSNFPRAPYAARAGLHGAFAIPVRAGDRILGVMEFFSHAIQEPDADLLALMAALGSQLGQFVERKQVEESLRDSETRMRAVLDMALDCVVSMDHEGRIIEFNPAAEGTFGYTRAYALGKSMAELIIPPGLRQEHERGLARYLATGEGPVLNKRLELTALRADGAEFPVELTILRLPVAGAPAFTAFVRDITDRARLQRDIQEQIETHVSLNAELLRLSEERDRLRRAAEGRAAALEELDRLKDEFIAVASHDLKGPLASIRGLAQVLGRRLAGPVPSVEAALEGLEVIDTQAAAMAALLDDLLDASRIQAGMLDLNADPCDLRECLEGVLVHFSPEERERITVQMPDEPLEGRWDRRRVQQVLANLLRNAQKYSPADQRISVRMERRPDELVVAVLDRGAGIPPEELPKLFERFYRTPQARTSGLPGIGLGLYICRGIITAHGGRIWAESTGEGMGATFRFTLPVTDK